MPEYDLQWVRGVRRSCPARLSHVDSPTYFGRCELARGHDGDHALDRGFDVVRWRVIDTSFSGAELDAGEDREGRSHAKGGTRYPATSGPAEGDSLAPAPDPTSGRRQAG